MTGADLTLTLPASREGGRRTFGLVASAAAHAGFVLILVASVRSATHMPQQQPPSASQNLVWVTPVTLAPPIPTLEAPKATKPIDYAAAPAGLAPARDWRELLPLALALQAQGINAPSFVIDNLDPQVVTMLVARHLAILVAGTPPFDRDARQVHWTEAGAIDVGLLAAGWTERVARRVIVLPRAWVSAVTLTADEQVFLLITTDLDAAILAAQIAVAEQRGVALPALARTHGRIVAAPQGLVEFKIDVAEVRSTDPGSRASP